MSKFPWVAKSDLEEAKDAEGLLRMFDDDRYARRGQLRSAILLSLSRLDDPAVTPFLIGVLEGDSHRGLQVDAAYALARRADPDSFAALANALKEASDYRIRMHAARGLGAVGGDSAVSPLIAALRDRHKGVRWLASEALGLVGDDRATDALIDALDDRSMRTRVNASRSLAQIGARRALPAMRRRHRRTPPPWRTFIRSDIRTLEENWI